MSTSTSPPAQTLPKLPAQTYRLDVPLDDLPQPPRDSSLPASAEHFRYPVLCLAVLPRAYRGPGPRGRSPRAFFCSTRRRTGICWEYEARHPEILGDEKRQRAVLLSPLEWIATAKTQIVR